MARHSFEFWRSLWKITLLGFNIRPRKSLRETIQSSVKPEHSKVAWLDVIAADHTPSEPVRQRALQVAREWK